MAIWMQVGNVAFDYLEDEAQVERLESLESADWVKVTDGDWSRQYAIDLEDVISFDALVQRIEVGDEYGYFVANEAVDVAQIARLRSLLVADRGDEETRPSPWSMGGDGQDHLFLFEVR